VRGGEPRTLDTAERRVEDGVAEVPRRGGRVTENLGEIARSRSETAAIRYSGCGHGPRIDSSPSGRHSAHAYEDVEAQQEILSSHLETITKFVG